MTSKLPDFANLLTHHQQQLHRLRLQNSITLCKVLAAHGIVTVIIPFDGYGDEGQIGKPEALDSYGQPVQLPEPTLDMLVQPFDGQAGLQHLALPQALERFAWDVLAEALPGWEINEGSHGDIILDVAKGKTRLSHTDRPTQD